jgi:hypothetical protein
VGTLNVTVNGGTGGTGGAGGTIFAAAVLDLTVGVTVAPTTPTAPTAPTGADFGPIAGDISQAGSVFISSTVTNTAAGATLTITSTFGDIVISGSLTTFDQGVSRQNLLLSAPNGTVYVTGSVSTSGQDGSGTGDQGGNVTINTHRIVITGTIVIALWRFTAGLKREIHEVRDQIERVRADLEQRIGDGPVPLGQRLALVEQKVEDVWRWFTGLMERRREGTAGEPRASRRGHLRRRGGRPRGLGAFHLRRPGRDQGRRDLLHPGRGPSR